MKSLVWSTQFGLVCAGAAVRHEAGRAEPHRRGGAGHDQQDRQEATGQDLVNI